METKELDQHLDESLDLFDAGRSFQEIRGHLKAKGLSDDTIKYIIRLVDEFVIEQAKIDHKRNNAKIRMRLGVLITVVGVLVIGGFYIRDMLIGFYEVFAFGPLALGILMIYSGWREYQKLKNTAPEIEDTKLKLKRMFGK